MAPKYRQIDPRIWDDEVFDQIECPREALAVFYLLTANRVNRVGVFVGSLSEASAKVRGEGPPQGLGDPPLQGVSGVWGILSSVCTQFNWPLQKVGRDCFVVIFPRWFRYNPVRSADTLTGYLRDLQDVPRCKVACDYLETLSECLPEKLRGMWSSAISDWREGVGDPVGDPVGEGPRDPVGDHEHEQEQEQEQEHKEGAGSRRQSRGKATKWKPESESLPWDDLEFVQAWREWCQHRREIRKPLTKTSTRQQIAKLQDMGRERALAAILHTISKGWQGLREPENNGKAASPPLEAF